MPRANTKSVRAIDVVAKITKPAMLSFLYWLLTRSGRGESTSRALHRTGLRKANKDMALLDDFPRAFHALGLSDALFVSVVRYI
jgi:hypothetical protein